MKKTFFLAILAISVFAAQAQGNLQFNQVKLVSTIETVPAGKIWKVESVLYNTPIVGNGNATIAFSIGTDASILINGTSIVTRSSRGVNTSQGGAYYSVWDITLPLWLPSGTTLSSSTGVGNVSVIEFNVIQ